MTSEALALMRDSRMKKIHTQVGKNKKTLPRTQASHEGRHNEPSVNNNLRELLAYKRHLIAFHQLSDLEALSEGEWLPRRCSRLGLIDFWRRVGWMACVKG